MVQVSTSHDSQRLPAGHVSLRLPARAEYIALCRTLAGTIGEMCHLKVEAIDDLKLAVTEACGNAVRHAYPAPGGSAEMQVDCEVIGSRITIAVRDWGRGVTVALQEADTHGSGYGLRLIEALADDVTVGPAPDGGTQVRFTRLLEPDGG